MKTRLAVIIFYFDNNVGMNHNLGCERDAKRRL